MNNLCVRLCSGVGVILFAALTYIFESSELSVVYSNSTFMGFIISLIVLAVSLDENDDGDGLV